MNFYWQMLLKTDLEVLPHVFYFCRNFFKPIPLGKVRVKKPYIIR